MEVVSDHPAYPSSVGSSFPVEGDMEPEAKLQRLSQRKQHLLASLQSRPFQRNEIQSQLENLEKEIYYIQQQQGHPVTPVMDNGYSTNYRSVGQCISSPLDSAIGSGTNTNTAVSMVGDADDLEQFHGDGLLPGMVQGQVPPNTMLPNQQFSQYQGYQEQQSRATEQQLQASGDRVAATMFPESAAEGEKIPSTQLVADQPTNLQQLSQPSQMLRTALQNLVNYQSNTELTARALPEISAHMSHQDQSVVAEAAKLMHELSKKEGSLQAVVGNPSVVRQSIQTLTTVTNAEIQKPLSGMLHNISNDRQGLMVIYNCGGIPFLVQMLNSQVDSVLFYAITTLHNMLLHYEPAKMDVRLAGGLEKMVGLLLKDNVKFLAITVDCLHILAYGHQDSKLIILASQGPALLVRIMRIYTYEKLLWTVSRVLKALSVCPSNKPEIVANGGMQVLSMHLSHRSTRLVHNILFTLRNLSDAATKQDNLDELLQQLILLLSSPDVNIVTCSAGVLSNLTCNNAKNKTIVCQLNGVDSLLLAISNAGDRQEIVERCVCSLRHITSRHPGADTAQLSIREANGIPMLMNLLQPHTRWPMIKALIGLFRNLALNRDNHMVLRTQGCIPKLWQLLNRAYQESQRRGHPGVPPGFVDGVSMNEVVECSTGALHLLARDSYNRLIMRQLNVIPMFVQLLYSQHEAIQRAAVGALSEMAVDPEGAEQVERENAVGPLTELLQSTNEGISAYAAAVLYCLSDDKHMGVPKRMMGGEMIGAGMMRNDGMMMGGGGHPFYSGSNPMLAQRPMHPYGHDSYPGSIPGSQPFTPSMSEPHSGMMTPQSEFDFPIDLDMSAPGSGFHSAHRSGVQTPNHPHHSATHSGYHTPNPAHHSGLHTPTHSGMHTPNHFPSAHPQATPPMQHMPVQMPHPQTHPMNPAAANPSYQHVMANYNPPSPNFMDTAGPWVDTDL